jgi:signal transduction histidine kinase
MKLVQAAGERASCGPSVFLESRELSGLLPFAVAEAPVLRSLQQPDGTVEPRVALPSTGINWISTLRSSAICSTWSISSRVTAVPPVRGPRHPREPNWPRHHAGWKASSGRHLLGVCTVGIGVRLAVADQEHQEDSAGGADGAYDFGCPITRRTRGAVSVPVAYRRLVMRAATAGGVWSRRLASLGEWNRGRLVGEAVGALVLAVLAAAAELTSTEDVLRVAAVVLGVVVLFLLRRVLPATVLVVAGAAAGQLYAAVPLLICASWSAGSRIASVWRAVAAFSAAVVLQAGISTFRDFPGVTWVTVMAAVAFSVGASVVPGLAGRYGALRRTHLGILQRHNAQLTRERAMVAWQARMMERNRIALGMHDNLGHQLALISVQTGALEVDGQLTEQQRRGVAVLRSASVTAMRELREVVGVLRDEPNSEGEAGHRENRGGQPVTRGVAAINDLVESSRAPGASIELSHSGSSRSLPPAADHAAYRIVQEGLTNAFKHAPGAPVTVALRYEPDTLLVEVANGPVPDDAPQSAPEAVSGEQGLRGLRERARLIGGLLHSGALADGGFRLAGVLPYEADDTSIADPVEDAPLVAEADDFWRQSFAGVAADAGAEFDRSAQKEELAVVSKKRNTVISCAVTAGLVVLGISALVGWLVLRLVEEGEKAMIPPSVYESARVGQPEKEIQAKLPKEDSIANEGVEDKGPPLPKGAKCRHFMSDEDAGEDEVTQFRFCFRDGKLVEKRTFRAQL